MLRSAPRCPPGLSPVPCIAANDSGLSSTCSFNVTVGSSAPPQIQCPADITQCSPVVNYIASASDTCNVASLICTPPSGATFPPGLSQVTCIAANDSGLSSTCSFNVTVGSSAPPQIQCPADITQCSPVVNYIASASDTCNVASLICTPPSGATFPPGLSQVTCIAANDSGLSSSCSFNVTVGSSAPPQIQCPADITQCSPVVNYIASASDTCNVPSLICTPPSGATFPPGLSQVTCIAANDSGLSSTCSFNVTVGSSAPPQIQCPADITQCSPVVNYIASASDTC